MSDPTPHLVTLCIWRGYAGPPPVFGRTAEDAEQRLLAHLIHFYTHEADDHFDRPGVRARRELHSYKNMGLLCCMAPNEAAAFTLWVDASSLMPDEALRRFREVFPTTESPDPLLSLSRTLPQRQARRLSPPDEDRLRTLARIADKLPRMSEPGVDELRQEFQGKTK